MSEQLALELRKPEPQPEPESPAPDPLTSKIPLIVWAFNAVKRIKADDDARIAKGWKSQLDPAWDGIEGRLDKALTLIKDAHE